MLNNINKFIVQEFALIQNAVNDNAACDTLAKEIAFMVAGGKERIYFNQLASTLTGELISRVTSNIVVEENIRVRPEGTIPREQSLNGSLYMVACYSVLMNGYTSKDILESALTNWADEDSVDCGLDFSHTAELLINQFIVDGIITTEQEHGRMETGETFNAHPATNEIQELRNNTMLHLWDKAPPKMKPMLHKISWNTRGQCAIPNLTFKEKVTVDFIRALNRMGHTGYKVNPVIRAMIKRNIKRGLYGKDELQTMTAMLRLDPMKTYYFPHTPDYRGRVYARGGLTTFQGTKDVRAAFDFADTKTVSESGLFLHIANAYGNDKLSLVERAQWVANSHMQLMTVQADTLYAERARLAYIEYKETGKGNVICHIDGTCSGVQITSGLFLDKATGAAVNVGKSTPTDTPADCYGLVARAALKLAKKGTEKTLIAKYSRDLTKKVVMILAYGAGEDTLIDTVKDFLISVDERPSHAKGLYKLIMDAIAQDFPALTKLNTILQLELTDLLYCGKAVSKLKYSLSDMTINISPVDTSHLNLYGSSYTAKLKGEALPSAAALARGIAPNFVHSLDSELLRKTVLKLDADISCIHDDVGVHSCDVERALMALKSSYVEVIKAEPLKTLYTALGIADEYEEQDNGLDLNDVLESSYLFS